MLEITFAQLYLIIGVAAALSNTLFIVHHKNTFFKRVKITNFQLVLGFILVTISWPLVFLGSLTLRAKI